MARSWHIIKTVVVAWLALAMAAGVAVTPRAQADELVSRTDPAWSWDLHAAGFVVITHRDPRTGSARQTWHRVLIQDYEGTPMEDLLASIGPDAFVLTVDPNPDATGPVVPYVYVVERTPAAAADGK